MKLVTNIHHVNGNCWKGFSRSEVKGQGHVYKCVNAVIVEAYISMVWHRDLLVCHICVVFSPLQTTVLRVHIAVHYALSCRTATAEKCGHFD